MTLRINLRAVIIALVLFAVLYVVGTIALDFFTGFDTAVSIRTEIADFVLRKACPFKRRAFLFL